MVIKLSTGLRDEIFFLSSFSIGILISLILSFFCYLANTPLINYWLMLSIYPSILIFYCLIKILYSIKRKTIKS